MTPLISKKGLARKGMKNKGGDRKRKRNKGRTKNTSILKL